MRKLFFIFVIIIPNLITGQDLNHWILEKNLKSKDIVEKKIAFLIANSNYENLNLSLKNPLNDVKKISISLEKLGFTIVKKEDVTLEQLNKTINIFKDSLKNYDFGLFYYAGHGLEDQNGNPYILPIDANELTSIKNNSESLNDMINFFGSQIKKCLVIIDACRNKGNNGLHKPNNINHPDFVKLWYSTSSGKTASDEEFIFNGNPTGATLYANVLSIFLEKANETDLNISEIFQLVYKSVKIISDSTEHDQSPSQFYGPELNTIYFK